MSRRPRGSVLYDNCFAHIISRSIEDRRILRVERDFEVFKEFLLEAKLRGHFSIFHYCLMHTHFHMAVRIQSLEAFWLGMKWLKREWTNRYNSVKKRKGTIWQGRYKSLLIEDFRYLRACGLYIENNPVKAGLVKTGFDWKYSSALYYGKQAKDDLIDPYEWSGSLPVIEEDEEKFFEHGTGVGSDQFRFFLRPDAV